MAVLERARAHICCYNRSQFFDGSPLAPRHRALDERFDIAAWNQCPGTEFHGPDFLRCHQSISECFANGASLTESCDSQEVGIFDDRLASGGLRQ